MSGSPRAFWNASTAVSVAAVLFVLLFWATSYYRCRVFSDRGRVLVLVVKADPDTDRWLRVSPPTARVWQNLRPDGTVRFAGAEFAPPTTIDPYEYTYYAGPTRGTATATLRYGLLAVPYWLLAVVAALPAVFRARAAIRRRHRSFRGRCRECGYDLSGNVSGVCPECGTVVKA